MWNGPIALGPNYGVLTSISRPAACLPHTGPAQPEGSGPDPTTAFSTVSAWPTMQEVAAWSHSGRRAVRGPAWTNQLT